MKNSSYLFPSAVFRAALVSAGVLACLTRSEAVLVAYDGFDYTVGESIIGQDGGTGWNPSSAWAGNNPGSGTVTRSISSTSITYDLNGFTYGGGTSLEIGGANLTRVADRTVNTASLTTGQDIYFSYVVQAQGGAGDLSSTAFSAWYTRDSGGISTTDDNAFITGNLGKVAARANSATTTNGALTLQYNTTYLIVGRISGWDEGAQAYRTTSVWLNPDLDDFGTPSAVATGTTGGTGAFVGTVLRINGLESSGTTFLFDDMRIGTSWDAVVIPEPGTAGLLVMAATGLLLVRGRGRKD